MKLVICTMYVVSCVLAYTLCLMHYVLCGLYYVLCIIIRIKKDTKHKHKAVRRSYAGLCFRERPEVRY